ncbi:hypothetical protein [Pseudovibrio sp. Tun.PSC04-5.I4]|uniref:hypothetical protein n=1 Tax=Pseudovibrio sp. Tun.PSC04-5.I4 TaxID=1798213 RepID=UPI000880EA45|nr:hypothetical protein [Pseudovibrio sp. Tun.PSC04-5.I4]SDQ13781.1 hypothetical protein SAMN04515695_0120 [Pseudovibrio sp. Tun.PSC04-5.I4]
MLLANQKMLALYEKKASDSVKKNAEICDIANSGFEKIGDCYFLKKLLSYGTNVSLSDFIDKTGYECLLTQ